MAEGVRAPSGELTCTQRSKRLKDDKLSHTDPNFACGYTAKFLLRCQVQLWAKA